MCQFSLRQRERSAHSRDAKHEQNLERSADVKVEALKFADPCKQLGIAEILYNMLVQPPPVRIDQASSQ